MDRTVDISDPIVACARVARGTAARPPKSETHRYFACSGGSRQEGGEDHLWSQLLRHSRCGVCRGAAGCPARVCPACYRLCGCGEQRSLRPSAYISGGAPAPPRVHLAQDQGSSPSELSHFYPAGPRAGSGTGAAQAAGKKPGAPNPRQFTGTAVRAMQSGNSRGVWKWIEKTSQRGHPAATFLPLMRDQVGHAGGHGLAISRISDETFRAAAVTQQLGLRRRAAFRQRLILQSWQRLPRTARTAC